jgi:hypothetical protein
MRVPDWTTWQSVNDEFEGSVHREPDGVCKCCKKPAWLNENEVTDCCGKPIYNFNEDDPRRER